MKFNADIFIDRGKARLVDEVFAQKEGTGFEETSAPVAKKILLDTMAH